MYDIELSFEMPLLTLVARQVPVTCHSEVLTPTLNFTLTGIYYEPNCSSKDLDHGVLVVGYGSEGAQSDSNKFWIVKNRYKITDTIFEIEKGILV